MSRPNPSYERATARSSLAASVQPSWHRGMVDRLHDRPLTHACAEIIAGPGDSIGRRIWRGQVSILFPFLEDHRYHFARTHQALLRPRLPIRTEYETINDPESLELSHLIYLLKGKVNERKLETLEFCRRLRNELAHLRPLSATDLRSAIFDELAGAT